MKPFAIAILCALTFGVAYADSLYPLEQGKNATTSSFFNDSRARKVGDPITVIIVENATGTVTSSAKASVSSNGTGGYTGPTGNIARTFGLDGATNSSGDASVSRTDALNATMAARITKIYDNGIMKIDGTKTVENNNQQESIQVTGFIRQQDIAPDNTINSRMIADAQITYTGKSVTHRRLLFGFIPI
ncbi:MAG: flagellar basal body L-ring protein FlgH [Capsulimonadaceae bacterium]|nr:flagellar basal body L-ring protein FlgH [Capsulimonadaceae bacterium]